MRTTFPFLSKNISLDVFAPERAGTFPVVCALHGSGGMHNPEHLKFAQLLANQGFLVCVPHYFESTGTIWADDSTIWREFAAWMETITSALDHVSRDPAADSSRMAIVGFSLGAFLALALASEQPRIKAVVDFFGGIPEIHAAKMTSIAPVLILHGEADTIVPVAEARKLVALLDRHHSEYEIKLYHNAGHGFRGFDMMDAGKRTYDFLKKHLGNGR